MAIILSNSDKVKLKDAKTCIQNALDAAEGQNIEAFRVVTDQISKAAGNILIIQKIQKELNI